MKCLKCGLESSVGIVQRLESSGGPVCMSSLHAELLAGIAAFEADKPKVAPKADVLHVKRATEPRPRESEYDPLIQEIERATNLPLALEGIYKSVAFLPSRVDARRLRGQVETRSTHLLNKRASDSTSRRARRLSPIFQAWAAVIAGFRYV